jgi:hypothetical protein
MVELLLSNKDNKGKYLTFANNGTAHFKKCKKLFEHQELLFLRDI